jgi:hypothetical protein
MTLNDAARTMSRGRGGILPNEFRHRGVERAEFMWG